MVNLVVQVCVIAVDVYNRPGPRFRTAHYVVLVIIAWTALFHSIFYKRQIKPWYKRAGSNPRRHRYVRVDGDPKHWDLAECVRQFYGANTTPGSRWLCGGFYRMRWNEGATVAGSVLSGVDRSQP